MAACETIRQVHCLSCEPLDTTAVVYVCPICINAKARDASGSRYVESNGYLSERKRNVSVAAETHFNVERVRRVIILGYVARWLNHVDRPDAQSMPR
jgi:hypothetical protein